METDVTPHPSERGLSLVEVLVSLGVLSFLALSVMTMVTTAIHLNKLSQERSVATTLAAERIHQMKSMDFRSAANYAEYALPGETVGAGPPQTFTTAYGGIPDYPDHRRTVELTYDTPVAGVLKVEVSVFWEHINQPERSHTMIEFLHPELQ